MIVNITYINFLMELFHHSFDRIFFWIFDGKENKVDGFNLRSGKDSMEKIR